jgi:hypothetical protein
MDIRTHTTRAARLLAATGVALLTTLVLVKVGANSTAAGMVFLVLVVWSATQAWIKLALFEAILFAALSDASARRVAGMGSDVFVCGVLPGGRTRGRDGAEADAAG